MPYLTHVVKTSYVMSKYEILYYKFNAILCEEYLKREKDEFVKSILRKINLSNVKLNEISNITGTRRILIKSTIEGIPLSKGKKPTIRVVGGLAFDSLEEAVMARMRTGCIVRQFAEDGFRHVDDYDFGEPCEMEDSA